VARSQHDGPSCARKLRLSAIGGSGHGHGVDVGLHAASSGMIIISCHSSSEHRVRITRCFRHRVLDVPMLDDRTAFDTVAVDQNQRRAQVVVCAAAAARVERRRAIARRGVHRRRWRRGRGPGLRVFSRDRVLQKARCTRAGTAWTRAAPGSSAGSGGCAEQRQRGRGGSIRVRGANASHGSPALT
jgi:hypothetical protein